MKSTHRGFTLIELLVVISIIALLASIILAALNTSLDRAHLAAGEQFADQVYHTIGDQIIGDWEFNEGPGSTANDSSGNGNKGNLFGSPGWVANTPDGTGYSLSFSGATNQYVDTTTFFPSPGPQTFTISVWFKTSSAPSGGGKIVGFEQSQTGTSANYDRQIYMGSDGKIYFGVWIGSPAIVASSASLADGKWHNAVGTNNGTNEYLYIDGVLQGENTNATPLTYGGWWRINGQAGGSPWPATSGGFFNGNIDNVRIYSEFMPP